MKSKDWEEEFEKFTYSTKPVGNKIAIELFKSEATPKRVKKFIRSLLSQAKREGYEEIDRIIINKMKEYANTEIGKRINGYEMLVELQKALLTLQKERKI